VDGGSGGGGGSGGDDGGEGQQSGELVLFAARLLASLPYKTEDEVAFVFNRIARAAALLGTNLRAEQARSLSEVRESARARARARAAPSVAVSC
jgi:hypothetical protein